MKELDKRFEWADLPQRLAADLASAPSEVCWRSGCAPQLSFGRHDGPPLHGARAAAVVALLCRDGEDWTIPLTVRHAQLKRHGGQVSFPGGLLEPGETAWQAAVRELSEELGYYGPLQRIGQLEPLWVFASHVWVTPFVAVVANRPDWQLQADEVAALLTLSCRRLAQGADWKQMKIVRDAWTFHAPFFPVEDIPVWGATAVLLGELQGRLQRLGARASCP